ncbi:Putative RNA-directed DNA polymerase [Arachis hypogaea]|nr:Putative RNA-directed DNA polymerase [Arachis hypogaea]
MVLKTGPDRSNCEPTILTIRRKSQKLSQTTAARSGILPPSVALKVRRPSVYLASLVLQVFNPCSLSPIAAASSSSASVVFVCSAALPPPFVCRSRSRLRSAVIFVRVLRRSRSLGVHRSRSLAVHRSSSHSRSSGSHVALLQTLRPTRALHLAVELLSFVAVVSSLNPPPDNTLNTTPILCFKLCNF